MRTAILSQGVRAIHAAQLRAAYIVLAKYRDTGRFRLQTYTDYRWVRSDADGGPFTFSNVCLALGLDPEAVRQQFTEDGLLSPKLSIRVWSYEHPPRTKRRKRTKRKRRPGEAKERRRRRRAARLQSVSRGGVVTLFAAGGSSADGGAGAADVAAVA